LNDPKRGEGGKNDSGRRQAGGREWGGRVGKRKGGRDDITNINNTSLSIEGLERERKKGGGQSFFP